MAVSILDAVSLQELRPDDHNRLFDTIITALKMTWNTRGAADLVKLEAELSTMRGVAASGPYVKDLDRALRSLDR
jgi:hypothetical protein